MKFQNPDIHISFRDILHTRFTYLFEISCTQDFQILFSKGNDSEKGHNSDKKKKYGSTIFHEESVYDISKP